MTAQDAILTALINAGKRIGFHQFTTAEIVVAAYGFDPKRFAMRGYTQHPDSKRVTCELSKLRQKGFVRLSEQHSIWIVTEAGYERVMNQRKGAA